MLCKIDNKRQVVNKKMPGWIMRYPPGLGDMGIFICHGLSTPMLLNSSELNWARSNSAPAKTMSRITIAAARMYMAASFH